jgi:HEAT repeat protein
MVLLHDFASGNSVSRALELLKGISDGCKLLRSFASALAEADESRPASGKKVASAGAQFREHHMRRRADAVESLYGFDTPETRELLWELTRYEGNRVAANALVSLYWLSEIRVFAAFRQMALHPDRRFRASALWAIGKSGDQRFSELLVKLLEDPEPALRRAALAVMRAAKDRLARASSAPPLRVKILRLSATGGERRAWLVARDADGQNVLDLSPRCFFIRENGAPVEEYEVDRIRPEGPVNIGVLLVAARRGERDTDFAVAEQAIWQLLNLKRPEDRCALLKLRTGGAGVAMASVEVSLLAQTWLLRRVGAQPVMVMDEPPERATAEGLLRLIEALQTESGPRHIFCCFTAPGHVPEDVAPIVASARAAGVAVHVIMPNEGAPPEACGRLAEGTGGAILQARSPSALRDCWRMLYQAIISGYVARWKGTREPGTVSLKLSTGAAAGNAAWPEGAPRNTAV